MKKLKTVLLTIFLMLVPVTLAAQPDAVEVDKHLAGVISGQVYDAETQEPLAAVNVFLDSLLIGAVSESDGKFVLRYIQPGAYRLVASRLGYKTYEGTIAVAPGKLVAHQIALLPAELNGEAVTVTATRREQTAQMAPASVVILNARDLRERSVVTFDQALEMVPGISIHRASGISVQSLSIRGSSDVAGGGVGNRVLLMIDGRPALTSDSGGALWSLVPTNFIDHIEVVKGPFSSLYGSTAMGGVINVITRRPAYRALTTVDLGYGFFDKPAPALRYTERTPQQSQIELSHSGHRGRFSYLLNLSRKQSDGHTENTAYEFYNVYGKALYDFRQNRNLEFSFGLGKVENDYPHTWLFDQRFEPPVQPFRVTPGYRDDRQRKTNYSLDLHYWAVPSPRLKYASRFYFYRNHARSLFNENDPLGLIPDNQPFGLKTIVEADKAGNITQIDYYLSDHHYLITGFDLQADHVDSSPDTVMYGNRQVNNVAIYAQDEIAMTPKMTATVGLRYDWNHLVNGVTQRQLSPKLAFVYRPQDELALRLLLGQAFRSPSIAERFFQRELGGGTQFKPNPNLKPERLDFSLETGWRWRWRDAVEIDIAYFRYHYRDMLYWIEISAEEGVLYTLFQVRNLNRALMQGLETELRWHWKNHLRASLSYTYLDAKDQSPNRTEDFLAYRVRHAMFFAAEANVNRLTLALHGQYKSKLEEVFLYPRDIPQAFVVANAKATLGLSERYQLSFAANNLFNKQYEELERYRMPGRNWIIGARAQF
ncbi:MAG: TonB-dependent receptor [candidate division KSB1 bacterium]|nr:TonB-dependent receptor [candidate division KSB1 bacterium]MDZ7366536.1 TonB-dependent receptor [candidate division KSB1 bacterium]MDZ7405981.1 TonB-dependent receptor [candidate division KSB1 bacterium]